MKVTLLIAIAVLVLGGVAIFTGLKLYQLRNQSVSPNAPENVPAATLPPTETPTASPNLTIVGSSELGTATPVATLTPTPRATLTPVVTSTPKVITPSPTAAALPQAGISWPTWMGVLTGIFFLVAALFLII